MESDPDRRADRLPPTQPDSRRGHAGLHHHHGRTAGHICTLPLVRPARPGQEGAKTRDQSSQVGLYLVWYHGHDPGAHSHPVILLPHDLHYGRGAVDCQAGGEDEGTPSGQLGAQRAG